MNKICFTSRLVMIAVATWLGTIYYGQALAQDATVVSIQAVAEKRGPGTPAWSKVAAGAKVRTGENLRTGKRSKADIKFGDGSLIRLGQLSSLEIRGDRETRLASGQLLFSFLKPGRILAGAGAAEIKGTAGVISINEDGTVRYALYRGVLDVVTALRTVQLTPGTQVTLSRNGAPGRVEKAPPLEFEGGQRYPELTSSPESAPFVGSTTQIKTRTSPQYRSVEIVGDKVRGGLPNVGRFTPFTPQTPTDPVVVNPTPFPTPGVDPVPDPFPTLPPGDSIFRLKEIPGSGPLAGSRYASRANGTPRLLPRFAQNIPAASSQSAAPGGVTANAVPNPATAPSANREESAEEHLSGSDFGLGATSGSDVRFIGALADGGDTVFGARLHAFGTKGQWYLDAAVLPLRFARNTPSGRRTNNQTTISDLSLTYRNPKLEVQVGRQRYLAGPTQATLYGSLIRADGRDVMDAIRLAPRLSSKDRLEFSYLVDAYVRDLPLPIGGRQKGYSARYSRQESWGNFGVNLLKYRNAPLGNATGYSLDYAVPVIRGQLELYGELGRDTTERRLASVGVYLPGLYQKTGLDVYVEAAKLKSSFNRPDPADELAVRVYKRVNKNADLMLSGSRFSDGTRSLILGVSIGDALKE